MTKCSAGVANVHVDVKAFQAYTVYFCSLKFLTMTVAKLGDFLHFKAKHIAGKKEKKLKTQ